MHSLVWNITHMGNMHLASVFFLRVIAVLIFLYVFYKHLSLRFGGILRIVLGINYQLNMQEFKQSCSILFHWTSVYVMGFG